EQLAEVRRSRRAVEAAAEPEHVVDLPVDQRLPRGLFLGVLVVGIASTELELEPLRGPLAAEHGDQALDVVVVDRRLGNSRPVVQLHFLHGPWGRTQLLNWEE